MLDWHGRSDADGRFTVTRIPPISAEERSELPAVPLTVDDPAWYGDQVKVYQSADGVLPDATIEVNPGRKPMESPMDSTNIGKANEVPGGKVRVNLPGVTGEPMVSIGFRMQKATTATVVFANVPAGRHQVMVFSGVSGDAARAPKIVDVVAGKTVEVTMNPGPCELQGNVRSGGQPVGGPDKYVGWFAYPPGILGIYQGSAQVQPNGSYSVEGLTPGDYELVVQGPTSMVNTFMAHVGASGSTVCNLNLPTGRIDGELIGIAPTPAPIPQVGTIQVWPRDSRRGFHRTQYAISSPSPTALSRSSTWSRAGTPSSATVWKTR